MTNRNPAQLFSSIVALGGDLDQRLTVALEELCDACNATGKKGVLTLKVNAIAEEGIARLEFEWASKEPTPAEPSQVAWIGPDGGLHNRNPKQMTLAEAAL